MARILLLSADVVGPEMAGPGIRYWEFARELSRDADVVLAVPNPPPTATGAVRTVRLRRRAIPELLAWCDVVVAQGFRVPMPALRLTRKVLVIDLYDPVPLALLAAASTGLTRDLRLSQRYVATRIRHLLEIGDFFLCAGERQRDFWLGMLAATGRLNPDTRGDDPLFRRLVAVVPFGRPADPPRRTGAALRGVHPALRETDRILLWGGGVWEWLDPLTPIRAMAQVAAKREDVKLVFLGVDRPNPSLESPRILADAMALARALELEGRGVVFSPGWAPYATRQDALLDADAGVSAHPAELEARFACRSRVLDYLWAGLPVLCTRGDELADRVEASGAGIVLAPGDVSGWSDAILRVVEDDELRRRCGAAGRELAGEMTWARVTAPLRAFCQEPRPAPDRRRRSRPSDLAALARYGWSVGRAVVGARGYRRAWRRLVAG